MTAAERGLHILIGVPILLLGVVLLIAVIHALAAFERPQRRK